MWRSGADQQRPRDPLNQKRHSGEPTSANIDFIKEFFRSAFRHGTASQFEASKIRSNAEFFYFQAIEMPDQIESRFNAFGIKGQPIIH